MYKQPRWWGKGEVYLAHQTWKKMSNPKYQPSHPKEYTSPEACYSPSTRPATFNTLPRDIRNMTGCKVDTFKRRLDNYLSTIPDEPQVLGYTAQRRADSNSVLDMAKFVNAHWPSQVEVFGDGDSPSRRGCAYSVAGVQ